MSYKKLTRILAALMAVLMLFMVGCSGAKTPDNTPSDSPQKQEEEKPAWAVTEYNKDEIIDENGQYIIEKLTNTKASELVKVGDKQVIYHKGQPYLFRAIHFRYDHLLSAKLDKKTREKTFDDGMRLAKEAGFNTVILYLNWGRFYDGKKYDFSEIEYQYSVAKKYDLKILWNWFGYDVCGFGGYRDWQLKDLKKYPPLKDENGKIIYGTGYAEGKPIPDLSAQSFIDIEVEALNQLCAWLNVNDTDRRTVGIQIENEPNNTEGGHGLWFSQYSNLANLINQLAKAIKDGPYSMITYVNLMSSGQQELVEGRDWTGQIKGYIDLEYLDIVGYDFYGSTVTPDHSYIKQGDNPLVMVEFGTCVWSVPGQTNYLLSNGYGMGYYHLVYYNEVGKSTSGLYRFGSKENPFILREGVANLKGAYEDQPELLAVEYFEMNKSINALDEIIAVTDESNMVFFNNTMKVKKVENKGFKGKFFTFKVDNGKDLYGSTGLLVKADNNTYYSYASKTATISYKSGEIKSASEGVYENGKWVKTKDVEIVDGVLTYEAGKAYQIIV
ncbi:MAG: hypothetical protein IJD00_03540 [Clostridia bacterium]|nr:hypothetical protein [Clostridia bacterium]